MVKAMTVKVKVIRPGLFLAVKGADVEQEIGTVLTVDKIEGALLNKVAEIGSDEGKTFVVGQSEAEIQARIDAEVAKQVDAQVTQFVADHAAAEEAKLQAEIDAEQDLADKKKGGK